MLYCHIHSKYMVIYKTRTKTSIRYAREKDIYKERDSVRNIETHSDDGNTQWWRKHTVMTETQSDEGNTQWWRKHTVMTETHCDDGNTLWWRKHTVTTETHSDDGNTQWWRKHTVMTEKHSDDENTKWWERKRNKINVTLQEKVT